jgi:hypothetical protein
MPDEIPKLPANVPTNFSIEQLPPTSNEPIAEVEKLPELPAGEGEQIDTTKPKEEEVKPVAKPAVAKEVEKPKEGEEEVTKGELTKEKEEPKEKEEVKEKGIKRFLKPPAGSKPREGEEVKPSNGDIDIRKYSPQEQTVLKNMSVQSRRFVAEVLDKNKELAKRSDGQWFQHPNAYVLHPEFQQARSEVQAAEAEGNYWAEQLALAKEGKEVTPLIGFDEKGNPRYGPAIKPDEKGQVEEQLRIALTQCNQVANQRKGDLDKMKKNFKQVMDNDLQVINQERENRFEWVKDPELLKHSLTVDDGKGGQIEKSIDQIRKDVTSLFPPYMSSHPAVQTSADLMVALIIARAELAEANNAKQVETIKEKEEERVEPSSEHRKADVKPSGKFGGVKSFSIEGAGIEV